MLVRCPYCDNLDSAIQDHNYCSHKGQNVNDVDTNAYHFSQNKMQSGVHLSRFSIRSVYNGYQRYKVGSREHVINEEKFLVVNEGQKFENEIQQIQNADGIVVAFNPNFLKYYLYNLNHATEQKLDNPFERTFASLYFYENSYVKTSRLDQLLRGLISDIRDGDEEPLYYQHTFVQILDELVGIEENLQKNLLRLTALKSKTREELYKRLSTARDYIDANLNQKLTIQGISRIACLSPFHFLRSFSTFYKQSPYSYILSERLKKAHFLIEGAQLDIPQILQHTGFEHKRTFQRAYQKIHGVTPHARLQHLRA